MLPVLLCWNTVLQEPLLPDRNAAAAALLMLVLWLPPLWCCCCMEGWGLRLLPEAVEP